MKNSTHKLSSVNAKMDMKNMMELIVLKNVHNILHGLLLTTNVNVMKDLSSIQMIHAFQTALIRKFSTLQLKNVIVLQIMLDLMVKIAPCVPKEVLIKE